MIKSLPLDMLVIFILIIAISGLGKGIFRLFKYKSLTFYEDFFFSSALGLLSLAYLVLILGVLGLLNKIFLYPVIIFLFILSLYEWKISLSKIRPKIQSAVPDRNLSTYVLLFILLFNLLSNFLFSYAPATGIEEQVNELALPKIYSDTGRIQNLAENSCSYYPQTVEMISTVLMILRGETAVKLFNYVLSVGLMILIYCIGCNFFNKYVGLLSAAIFYTMPIITSLAGVVNSDLGCSLYGILAILAFLKWREENYHIRWLWLTGLLAGATMSIKYNAVFVLFGLMLLLLFTEIIERKVSVSTLFNEITVFFIIVIVICSPWFLRNYLLTGNPLYPVSILGLPEHKTTAMYFNLMKINLNFKEYLFLLGNASFGKLIYSGGPLLFAFAPIALFIREKRRITGPLVALAFICLLSGPVILRYFAWRYMAIIYIILCIPSAFTIIYLSEGNKVRQKIILTLIIASLVLPNLLFSVYLGVKRLPLFLGFITKEEYLRKEIEYYPVIEYANQKLPQGRSVLLLGFAPNVPQYYFKNKVFPWDSSMETQDIKSVFTIFKQKNIDYIFILRDHFYITQNSCVHKFYPFLKLDWLTAQNEKKYLSLIHKYNKAHLYKINFN